MLDGAHLGVDVSLHTRLYLYLALATAAVFGAFGRYAGARLDAAEARAARLGALSFTDTLTALGNRRAFDAHLAQECARARRNPGPLTLVMADLDRFKEVNDRYGHDAGDVMLAHVGEVFRASTRKTDSACRVGGEEFAIICPATQASVAAELAERIRAKLDQEPRAPGDPPARVTASFGAAEFRANESDAEFFRRADAALYRAKEAGRNRVFVDV
jgi:diguanylate cyclase (GGDEF)-like protein